MLYQATQITPLRTTNVVKTERGTLHEQNFADFFSDSRETIDVNLPSENDAHIEEKFIGNTVHQTFLLNKKWLIRCFRLFAYYTTGCIFFCNVEGWNLRTAIYFITQTVSTVGYGNIAPVTKSGQMFCVFYMFAGILLVFSVIGDVTSNFVKHMRRNYKKPIKRSRVAIIVRNFINASMWIGVLLCLLMFGAMVYSLNEGWTFAQAFYFCAVTATSIGYGDMALVKTSSIWFNIFYILLAVSTTALALDKIGNVKRHIIEAEQDQQLNSIELTQELLAAINKDTQRITPAEYVLHMLQLAGKLDRHADINPWLDKFKEFDLDHDGLLTMNDVNSYAQIVRRIDLGKISRKRPNKKKSILLKVSEETKAVFLETFKLKKEDDSDNPDPNNTNQNEPEDQSLDVNYSFSGSFSGEDVEMGVLPPSLNSTLIHSISGIFNNHNSINSNNSDNNDNGDNINSEITHDSAHNSISSDTIDGINPLNSNNSSRNSNGNSVLSPLNAQHNAINPTLPDNNNHRNAIMTNSNDNNTINITHKPFSSNEIITQQQTSNKTSPTNNTAGTKNSHNSVPVGVSHVKDMAKEDSLRQWTQRVIQQQKLEKIEREKQLSAAAAAAGTNAPNSPKSSPINRDQVNSSSNNRGVSPNRGSGNNSHRSQVLSNKNNTNSGKSTNFSFPSVNHDTTNNKNTAVSSATSSGVDSSRSGDINSGGNASNMNNTDSSRPAKRTSDGMSLYNIYGNNDEDNVI